MPMSITPRARQAILALLVLLSVCLLACDSRPSPQEPRSITELAVRPSPTLPPSVSPTAAFARSVPTRPTRIATPVADPGPQFVVRAGRGGPAVREAPNEKASVLSGLYFDTYLPVYSRWSDAAGIVWYQVRLWGVLTGWIRADQTVTGD